MPRRRISSKGVPPAYSPLGRGSRLKPNTGEAAATSRSGVAQTTNACSPRANVAKRLRKMAFVVERWSQQWSDSTAGVALPAASSQENAAV